MSEELIKLLKTNRKYSLDEISKILKHFDKEDIKFELENLELNGTILFSENKYQIFPNNFELVNVMIDKNGCGYFYIDGKIHNIDETNLNSCLEGDLCAINMDTLSVSKIIKRKSDLIICEVNNGKVITSNNQNYEIILNSTDRKKLVEGNILLVKIKENDKNNIYCNLVEILGHINDPDIDLKQIAISKSFDVNFSKSALKQANEMPKEISKEELEGRLDLRNELIYTIDCDETKDMDDAISVKVKENGNYEIGIHIADVSHYIKFGSPLFKEALKRGNSLYMANTVIPMLMHIISNGICSLNPNEDRLTISCIVQMDKQGNIINYDIKKSVINSKKKMCYSDVNKILMDGEVLNGYENFIDNLKLANEISFILNDKYKYMGYLHFGNTEIKYAGDNDFKLIKPRAAEKIIENFMLLANKLVATHFEYLPFAFRIHEIPDIEKIEKTFDDLRKMGYEIPNVKNLDNPKILQGILKNIYESGDFSITSFYILKSMKKAKYSPSNIGHFGLGFDCYTHFTSPIRRFNDLLVHIIISSYLEPNIDEKVLNEINNNLYQICEHISEKERLADEAEEEALKLKMAEYMEKHIGEYFNGKIIDIHPNYLTVKLEENIIGTVHLDEIKNDVYYFDEEDYCIKGKKTNITFKIGDYVRTKVIFADKKLRRINFKITENLEHVKTKNLELKRTIM